MVANEAPGLEVRMVGASPADGTIHLSFSDRRKRPVTVSGEATARRHGLTITDLRVEHDDITTTTLRQLRLGELRVDLANRVREGRIENLDDDAAAIIEKIHPPGAAAGESADEALIDALQQMPLPTSRPARGRGAESDHFYRDIAIGYINAFEEDRKQPTKTLTLWLRGSLREPDLGRDTPGSWVTRAKRDGWLTGGARGVAGAVPGPRLIEWFLEGDRKQS